MATMQRVGTHKTLVYDDPATGETVCVYHSTPVVKFKAGVVTLDTGGWWTVTTKARMNQFANENGLSYRVTQERGDWFVYARNNKIPFTASRITVNLLTGEVVS